MKTEMPVLRFIHSMAVNIKTAELPVIPEQCVVRLPDEGLEVPVDFKSWIEDAAEYEVRPQLRGERKRI
jgi:hypothetical protein